jgi:Heparinase II/III-like protein/Heparinase II/III N-terminus
MIMTLARTTPHLRNRPVIKPRLDPELSARVVLDELLDGNFMVHGERHFIGDPVDWLYNPSADIEWHIVLHKMYHAPGLVQAFLESGDDRYLRVWQDHLQGWIKVVEPGFIAADVTGRRIQNWVYALSLYLSGGCPVVDYDFIEKVELSLREHISWLRDNIHPSRNHRTLELFAIFMGSLWLQSDKGVAFALDALVDNAETDFLPDGVHVELSSHYHCIALRNFIDVIELAQDNDIVVPQRLLQIIEKARYFAHALHKPDGLIPMLGDADTDDYRAMLGAGAPVGRVALFPDAGYVFLRDEAAVAGDPYGQYLVFDCGPLGAGNHGHLDCLSFELAAFGRSLIVDPGRYTYFEGGEINARAAFRGTSAHNLIQVDGREQTAYRQGPKRMKIAGPSPTVELITAHEDYVAARARSAEYDVTLERRIMRGDAGWWLVHDHMISPDHHDYDLRFQLSPETDGATHVIELPCGTRGVLSPNLLLIPLGSSEPLIFIEEGWVAPRYGFKQSASRVRCHQHSASGWFATLLVPFTGAAPDVGFDATDKGYRIALNGQGAVGVWQ